MDIGKCRSDVIVTIGRTFGSGGSEIGKKVAEKLEIPFYDKELLEIQARQSTTNLEKLEKYDEKRASGFLYSMAFNPYTGDAMPLDMVLQDIQTRAIEAVAAHGSCVIIGRRANKILRPNYDTLDVFVSAPIEKRIARISEKDGLSEKESRDKIQKMDRTRRAYFNSYGDGDWGEAANYHLCIDSGDLGIDNAVEMILYYLKLKGRLL